MSGSRFTIQSLCPAKPPICCAPMVRPWKAFSKVTRPIFRWPPILCPHERASLIAFSVVSAPVVSREHLLGQARPAAAQLSPGRAFDQRRPLLARKAVVVQQPAVHLVEDRLADRRDAACPAFVTSTPELQSSHMLPYRSQTCTPSARSQTIGGWPLHGDRLVPVQLLQRRERIRMRDRCLNAPVRCFHERQLALG